MPERAGPGSLNQLLDAVVAMGSGLELPTLLRRIVESATELVDARYGALGVLDETGTRLAQFITVGVDDQTHQAIGHLPEGHGILGLLIVEGKPIRLPESARAPRQLRLPARPPRDAFVPRRARPRA